MNDDGYKIVNFEYCNTCKHYDEALFDKKGKPQSCEICLSSPTNLYSEKPINYVEKTAKPL